MDLTHDEATPTKSLKMLDDGSFKFDETKKKFDVDRFNSDFDQFRVKRAQAEFESMQANLDKLNAAPPPLPIYQYSLGQILINTKDTLFDMLDDILQGRYSWEVLSSNNRLFYIGVLLIIASVLVYVMSMFTLEIRTTFKPGR